MSSNTRPAPLSGTTSNNPKSTPPEPPRSRANEERDWYASSYDLAHGLVVEEMTEDRLRELLRKP